MEESMKQKNAPKNKERRQPHSQDGAVKRSTKPGLMKSDLSQLPPPQAHDNPEAVRKILSEAHKIVKLGMEKDYALLERENTLQSSNELVENLRKNILHLQMEYEKLDQNYQREISQRSEVVKRMDATQETVDSVIQCSDVLSKSLKQLEADKLKIAEFYEVIYHSQKEVENKHSKVEKLIQEQDEILKTKMESVKKYHEKILSQHSETVSQLNKKLCYANDKVKVVTNENEKLSQKLDEFEQSSKKFESLLGRETLLNREHEENATKIKCSLKKAKIQRFRYQKLWKQKKMQVLKIVKQLKTLKRSLKDAELLHSQCSEFIKTLESKNLEWEKQFEEHLQEDRAQFQKWEREKNELKEKAFGCEAEVESLKAENKNLSDKLVELTEIETSKQSEVERIQNNLSKLLSENLKLKGEVVKYSEENSEKSAAISELQRKVENSDSDFRAEIEYQNEERKKLQEFVKDLESKIADLEERNAFEKREKENLISDFKKRFEEGARASNEKISDLNKLLNEKTACVQKLLSERNLALNCEKSLEELNNELKREKIKSEELNKNLETLKKDRKHIDEELEKAKKQISEYKEKVREVNSLNTALTRAQAELETNAVDLKSEIELSKKSFQALEEKQKRAEKELSKMNKMAEENSALKTSLADSNNLLKATEARVEAYKVVVQKLETEKDESQNSHTEEVSRLKAELTRLEEALKGATRATKGGKTARESSKVTVETPKKNFDQTNKKETPTPSFKTKHEKIDFFSPKPNAKENDPEIGDLDKWQNTSTPPLHNAKKFLSTPRKIFTSTPQPSFKSTPSKEKQKRDPYDFDSDSSVEKLDPDKVLKILGRQKKESNKRSRANK